MILSQDVLRWLTVKALRGRTWAAERVYDSPAQPADLKIMTERLPFISVYTDDSDVSFTEEGNEEGESTTCYLVIEVAAADQLTISPQTGDQDPSDSDIDRAPAPEVVTDISPTDEALEMVIGMISRQAWQALKAGDNPWSQLWRTLVIQRVKMEVRRGGPGGEDKQPAVRFASRVTRLHLKTLDDPVFGRPAEGFWKDFLDAAGADEELSGIADIVRQHIETDEPLPGWLAEQAYMGVTEQGVRGIGIAPVVIPDRTEPPLGTKVTTVDEGRVSE